MVADTGMAELSEDVSYRKQDHLKPWKFAGS